MDRCTAESGVARVPAENSTCARLPRDDSVTPRLAACSPERGIVIGGTLNECCVMKPAPTP